MAGPNSFDPIVDNTLLPYGENLIAQGTVHDLPHSAAFMSLRGHLLAQALSAQPG